MCLLHSKVTTGFGGKSPKSSFSHISSSQIDVTFFLTVLSTLFLPILPIHLFALFGFIKLPHPHPLNLLSIQKSIYCGSSLLSDHLKRITRENAVPICGWLPYPCRTPFHFQNISPDQEAFTRKRLLSIVNYLIKKLRF